MLGVRRTEMNEIKYSVLMVGVLFGDGCLEEAPGTEGRRLVFASDNLPVLGEGFVYEGWLIGDDGPVAAGRFTDPTSFEVYVEGADARATTYVLTIEPEPDADPGPSAVHVLGGAFDGDQAVLGSEHPAAVGTDFGDARGGFILETPSTTQADDYDQGIWFLDPSAGPGPGLVLPTLPAGWQYEGWVVVDGTPLSTGRFTVPDGADSDGKGPEAGPEAAPPFPGQDFIHPARMLVGATAVISVEPEPDDSPGPFFLKPLVGAVTDAGAGGWQALGSEVSAQRIRGTATWMATESGAN